MPYEYTIEMLCDYLGAGRAYHGKNFSMEKELEWWEKKKEHCAMHEFQREFFDHAFHHLNDGMPFNAYNLCFLYTLLKARCIEEGETYGENFLHS